MPQAKRKTRLQLRRAKKARDKSARSAGHVQRSREARAVQRKFSKAERTRRAKKAWRTRRKLYGRKGTA